jgi:hypothetical protein
MARRVKNIGVSCVTCRYAGVRSERCYARALRDIPGSHSVKQQAVRVGHCQWYVARH